jgi:hypothetical protein
MVTGRDSVGRRPPTDVAQAVRRGQRQFVLRLGVIWAAVCLVTAGLAWIGLVLRTSIHSGTPPWQLLSMEGLLLGFLVGAGVCLVGAAAFAIARSHRWRSMGRRLGGWLAVVPSEVWVTVVAVTGVLVLRNVLLGPPSVGQPPDPSVGRPPAPWSPTASPGELGLFAAAAGAAALVIGALARAVLGAVFGRRRNWYTSEAAADPWPVFEARLVRGSAQLTVNHEGVAKPSVTVEVRRHYDAGTISLAEVT